MSRSSDLREVNMQQGALRYDAALVADPGPWLFDPTDRQLDAVAVDQGGRRAAWFVRGPFGDAVLRHYRRGGLLAPLRGDRYLWAGADATRSFAEFALLHFMYSSGLPVPRPVAAAYWRQGLHYRAAILMHRIAHVQPLAAVLERGGHAQVAAAIFSMHEAGVWHADLNAYNILLDDAGKAWLIDFDKSQRRFLSEARRRSNLLRLRRSLVKVAGEKGLSWSTEFERAYGLLASAKGHL